MSEPDTAEGQLRAADPASHETERPRPVFRRPNGAALFYLTLALVLGAYTVLAFGMEWDTQAGRIGPGFFPRIIGVAGVTLAVVGLVNALRSPAQPEDAGMDAGADGHHPGAIAFIALALGGFVTVFIPLGAPLTAAAFLVLMYLMIDRKRILRRAVLSVLFPVALYLVLDVLLGASLPGGITDFI